MKRTSNSGLSYASFTDQKANSPKISDVQANVFVGFIQRFL